MAAMRIGLFRVADHHPSLPGRDVRRLYDEILEEAVCADALGFDSFWVAEHHFHDYGVVPQPAVLLAAISQRTRRIRLGAAVAVLPLADPLRIAEEYAMLDVLSGGRLEMGVGSGYLRHEFSGFGIPHDERRARFDESLAVILKAWTGERFSFAGKHIQVRDVALNVRPLQAPTPPLWIASLRPEAVPFIAAQGTGLLLIPYAATEQWAELPAMTSAYHTARLAAGHKAPGAIACGLHTFCGQTPGESRRIAGEALDRYVETRLFARKRTLDDLSAQDLIAVGDPEAIIRIFQRYADAGVTHILALTSFGGLPHADVLRSLERIAKYVLPHFHQAEHSSAS
jgi:alkanesulfonate monooxygenase SsuD/methylene tetrahydromethanopterin reductase-like flavin-dependent oxidoreductase (luciferase family)